MKTKLLLATANKGKIREFRELLHGIPYDVLTLADIELNHVAAETGATFDENARIKATDYAARSGFLTLADDSGLEVDALGGAPGIYSARYAGEVASDADRIAFLLANLKEVPPEKRSARFRCVIAVAGPSGDACLFTGECRGLIIQAPKGSHGFGYDPVFYLPDLGQTMAELPSEVKNRISHRARAAAKARDYLASRAGGG